MRKIVEQKLKVSLLALSVATFVTSCASPTAGEKDAPSDHVESSVPKTPASSPARTVVAPAYKAPPTVRDDEPHLKNLRQLTDEGENAEAYFNKASDQLIFQAKRSGMECDQIFRMSIAGENQRQVSVGKGRTTCSFIQNDDSIIYASTHGHGEGCLWTPDHAQGYVWPLYPEMDIWRADADGKNAKVLFESPGYDAEATICPGNGNIIFTSTKDGDLDLYSMDAEGNNIKQLTNTPGYDGGAFFSPDCSKIVWRASRPEGQALLDYQKLLKQNLVRPSKLEIYTADADGTNVKQLTHNGAANFGPYLHADNNRVLYVSNKGDPQKRNFDIYLHHIDSGKEEQITHNPTFDGFPMWSHDGKLLVFASNRNNKKQGDTNLFMADWVD